MTWFEAGRESEAVVHAGHEEIWAVRSDPALVARMTPFVSSSLTTRVDLPLARLATPAVTTTMKAVLADMGRRFSTNLLHHLGVTAD